MKPIDLKQSLQRFDEHWSPRIIADVNGHHVKLAKFLGPFQWHAHEDADEMFLVLEGSFTMEFRDRSVELCEGQVLVVPRGVEHRPVSTGECSVMLIEPAGLVNTSDADTTEASTTGTWLDGPQHPSRDSKP